ncbi:MAG: histidine phosphatase family protein [Kiloniellales bacterium]
MREGLPLVLLRHGPTDWNAARRIQGRTDRPLSEAGRDQVRRWRLPDELAGYRWLTSPLTRAVETAVLLGHAEAEVEPALIEMHWGGWEGWTLDELRQRDGAAMARNEARGLDFQPLGGESPRQVQQRLSGWLTQVVREGAPVVAISHKGVIRALYALASGWDMTGKPPVKLRWDAAHCFRLDRAGQPSVDRLNVPLAD